MTRILPIVLLLASACDTAAQGTSTTKGDASYVQPADEGGEPVAAQEDDADLQLDLAITGEGTFDAVDASLCSLSNGPVSTRVSITGTSGDDGAYASSYATSEASDGASNPLCGALTNVKLTSVTSITMTGSVPANDRNCGDFCSAQATSACDGHADEASCRETAEADCASECAGSSRIHGSGTASQAAVEDADTGAQQNGDVHATIDLVLADME
jgi:hypothetical protein